jgi:ribosomal protein S18 acetylase RimI-like enzyme
MKILVRDATSSEFQTIARISLEAYQEYATKLTTENWQIMARNISDVSQTAIVANFIVAEVESEIAGAIAYYSPGKSNPKFFDLQWASLRLLAVSPSYRGKGIGKRLTRESILRAKKDNAKGIGLYTSEIMATAQKMYSSLGFRRFQELPLMLGLRYWLYLLPFDDT